MSEVGCCMEGEGAGRAQVKAAGGCPGCGRHRGEGAGRAQVKVAGGCPRCGRHRGLVCRRQEGPGWPSAALAVGSWAAAAS